MASRRTIGTVAVAGILSAATVPAVAHPFGPPPVAELTPDGHELVVNWTAAEDDYGALGEAAGAGTTELGSAEASPALESYVADRLSVVQDGQPCDITMVDAQALSANGLDIRLACAQPVTEVDVSIGLLMDLDPAYRTVAVANGPAVPARTIYTAEHDEVHWVFGSGESGPSASWFLLGLAAVGSAIAVVLISRFVNRRRVRS